MKEMKAHSLRFASSLVVVKGKSATLSGDMYGVVNKIANIKKSLSEGMCKVGVSIDGVNGEVRVLKNSVVAVEASVVGLNETYSVVQRNIEVLDKWTVAFDYDQKFFG